MNKKQLYESIMRGVYKQLFGLNEDKKNTRSINDPNYIPYADRKQWGISLNDLPEPEKTEPEKNIVRNKQGRPITSSKIQNLYPSRLNQTKKEESCIRGYINTELNKTPDKIYYINNINDMNKFRNIIISAIYKFMQNNKSDDYNWEEGNKYFSEIYNLNDLDSFIDDMRKSYKQLIATPYFPKKFIQIDEPVKVSTGKRGRKRKQLTSEQQEMVDQYILNFGKGTPIDEIDEQTLTDIRKYTLYRDGFAYVVCRPIRDTSDPNAPDIVYKLVGNTTTLQTNTVRYTYYYQCMMEYGCYVDYMYVSPVLVDKYLRELGR